MRVVAIDTETETFAPARMAPPLVCVSIAEAQTGEGLFHVNGEGTLEYVRSLWEQTAAGEVSLVGHNFAYDVVVFMAQWPDMIETIFRAYDADGVSDTMVRQKLLDIKEGCYRGWSNAATGQWIKHGYYLSDLALRHLDRKLDKTNPWRVRYAELKSLPIQDWPEEAVSYAEDDAIATLGVWQAQQECAGETGALVDEPRQVRAALALHLAEVWGIRTDETGVLALKKSAEEEITSLSELLVREGLLGRNGSRRMKRAQERMLKVKQNGKETSTGRPCLDEESCLASGDEALIALSKFAKSQNILAKDVRAMEEGTRLPLHTRFDTLLETGRVSSSGPCLQNLRRKKGVRECFVPRPGHYYAACDFDKAELHTLAQVCLRVLGQSRLAERLNAGFDPHLDLGAQIIGISYEDALEFRDDPEVKKARQNGKPINLGLPGGMGANGLQAHARNKYGIDFTLAYCKRVIEIYLETWPEMPAYFDWVRQILGPASVGTIRQLFSNRIRGMVPYTVACNTFFQGLCADGAKAALWEVCKLQYAEPSSILYGCRTINFVHDELLVEVPIEMAHEAAMELQRVMVDAFNPWVPDVPVNASVALMKRWSKSAEPVWQDGRLVPWEEAA